MGVEAALLATSVIGAGMQAYGSWREGMDASEASKYNAEIARQTSEREATMVEASGALDASRQRKKVSRLVGTQKAQYGGAGVELTGSPLDVMINTAGEGELDAQIMEYNTRVKASTLRYQGQAQGAYDEKLAGIYERSGTTNMVSTLLTQGATIGSGYLTPAKVGSTKIGSYTGYRTSGGKPYGGY